MGFVRVASVGILGNGPLWAFKLLMAHLTSRPSPGSFWHSRLKKDSHSLGSTSHSIYQDPPLPRSHP